MLAYFAPGLVVLWACQQSFRFVGLSTYFHMDNWAFESVVGVVFAFVLGQIVSARARVRFEVNASPFRSPVFNSGLISENFLLKDRMVAGHRLCEEERREMLIEMAISYCGLSRQEAGKLEAWTEQIYKSHQISHRIYRPLLTLVVDEGIGTKAEIMNLRYVFFRNLNVASAYVSCFFVISAGYNYYQHVTLTDARIILPLALALVFALTSVMSRNEAVHSALNHVREVFDSAHHFYSKQPSAVVKRKGRYDVSE